jgi:D-sedoheptulose 7-phosphate isomerase
VKIIPAQRSDIPVGIQLTTTGQYFAGVAKILGRLPLAAIDQFVDRLFQAYHQNRALYIFGNGGSAALASHSACDLSKGTMTDGKRPFRVVSLTDNVPVITAWANDLNYDSIFAAQLAPLILPGDIAFAISGSGNSPNVLAGLRAARDARASNIGLTGFQGGKMKELCDLCIVIPSSDMQQIEDSHVCVMHAVFVALRNLIRNTDNLALSVEAGR